MGREHYLPAFLLWGCSCMLLQFWFSPGNYFYSNTCKDTAEQANAAALLKTPCYVKLFQSEVRSVFGTENGTFYCLRNCPGKAIQFLFCCEGDMNNLPFLSASPVKLLIVGQWIFFLLPPLPKMTGNHRISPAFSEATWIIWACIVLSLLLNKISQHTAGSLVSLAIIQLLMPSLIHSLKL